MLLLEFEKNPKTLIDENDGWEFSVSLHGVLFIVTLPREEFLIASQNCRKFRDSNAWSTLGQLTSDECLWVLPRMEGPVLPPPCCWPQCWLIPDVSWLWRAPPFLTPGCCAKWCVFNFFRILPHKSTCLTPSLWERLFSALPCARLLVSGNGSLRLGKNMGPLETKSRHSFLHDSWVIFIGSGT